MHNLANFNKFRFDLRNKHDLLGKNGFTVPYFKYFSIIKITSDIEINNIKITSNGKPNYFVFNENSIPSGKIHIKFARHSQDNLAFFGNNVHIENGELVFSGIKDAVILSNNNRHFNSMKIRTWGRENLVFLGANTTSNGLTLSSKTSSTIIGDDCMISNNVCIRNSDEHLIFDLNSLEAINSSSETIVYPYVWLCQNVLILKNTRIGSGAIIGAKSLITKNVPGFSVVGGNPAKILRQNVCWQRRGTEIQDVTLEKIKLYRAYSNI